MHRLSVWFAALAFLFFAPRAFAQDQADCDPGVASWTAACEAWRGIHVVLGSCPRGHLVFNASVSGAEPIGIDISSDAHNGFRQVNAFGISPIGRIDDWNTAPLAWHSAFDGVVECIQRNPTLRLGPIREREPSNILDLGPGQHRARHVPWRFALGLLIAAVGWLFAAKKRGFRTSWKPVVGFIALASTTYLFQRIFVPTAFFHQNGHGASWVGYALGQPSNYGPGYTEIFQWAVRRWSRTPETALFETQAFLCAWIPVCAWMIARSVGLRRTMAAAVSLAFVIEPALGRAARSESYFATGAALLMMATAILLSGSISLRIRSRGFLFGAVSAGFIVAQIARIHPIVWVPAALVPLAILGTRGPLRKRLKVTLAATAIIGLLGGLLSGSTMLATLRGSLGQSWGPRAAQASNMHESLILIAALAAIAAIAVIFPRKPLVFTSRIAVTSLILAIAKATMLSQELSPFIMVAYREIYAPAVLANVLGVVTLLLRPRVINYVTSGIFAFAVVIFCVVHWQRETLLPTDAREAQFALQWRNRLPDGAAVVYVSQFGNRVLALPLYENAGPHDVIELGVSPGNARTDFRAASSSLYYYRSSVCSSQDARFFCDELESRYELHPVQTQLFPAIASLSYLPYAGPTVEVGLYRMTNLRPQDGR